MHQVTRSGGKATALGASTGLILLLLALGTGVVAQSPVGAASPSGSSDGVIMYERRDHDGSPGRTFTIAPDRTGQVQSLADYDCCPVLSLDGQRVVVSVLAADGKRYTTGIVNADGTGYSVIELPNATVRLPGTQPVRGLGDIEAPCPPVQPRQVLSRRRLGDPHLVGRGGDGAVGDVGAQDLDLATGRMPAGLGRHQAVLATAIRAPDAVRVRLTSVNGGLCGT